MYSVKAHSEIINGIDAVGGLGIGGGAPEIVTGSRDGEHMPYPNVPLLYCTILCVLSTHPFMQVVLKYGIPVRRTPQWRAWSQPRGKRGEIVGVWRLVTRIAT